MPRGNEAIKTIEAAIALGFSVSEAFQRALGRTLTEFALGRWSIQAVSMCLRFYGHRVYPEIRQALAAELDIPREYVDRVIESQERQPAAEGAL